MDLTIKKISELKMNSILPLRNTRKSVLITVLIIQNLRFIKCPRFSLWTVIVSFPVIKLLEILIMLKYLMLVTIMMVTKLVFLHHKLLSNWSHLIQFRHFQLVILYIINMLIILLMEPRIMVINDIRMKHF